MSVFDRLESELKDVKEIGGVSALDVAELPAPLKKVMLLILRHNHLTYEELSEQMAEIPEEERLSQIELDESLTKLVNMAWLIKLGMGEVKTYKVRLRARPGSTLGTGVWGELGNKIRESIKLEKTDED